MVLLIYIVFNLVGRMDLNILLTNIPPQKYIDCKFYVTLTFSYCLAKLTFTYNLANCRC